MYASKFICIVLFFGSANLLSVRQSLAWTSAKGPLTDPIHQMAIDKVLASMSPADRNVLKDEQSVVDKDQDAAQSAEHAMTGITKAGQNEAAQKVIYIQLSEKLIHDALASAINARMANNSKVALPALGKAIHALEDATSPVHRGFQIWSDNFGIFEMAHHVANERVYPDDRTLDRYQSHLEGVVRYTYDIYMGTAPIPANFFDPISGNLIIPTNYLHTY